MLEFLRALVVTLSVLCSGQIKLTAQDLPHGRSHLLLVGLVRVVLQGDDHRVWACLEGVLSNGLNAPLQVQAMKQHVLE